MSFSYFESADESTIHVAKDMRDGLQLALGEEEVELSNSNREDAVVGVSPDLLWVNKAVYRAINEIPRSGELPVLYSWFRYGPSVPIHIFHTDNLVPSTLGEYVGNLQDSRSGSSHSIYEFFEFFRDLIRGDDFFSPEQSLSEYLLELYESAPAPYRDLYKNNIKIQQLLADIKKITDATPMTENRVEEYFSKFESIKPRFERSLYEIEEIPEDAEDHIIDFLYLIEDVLESFKEVDFVSRTQQTPINDLWYKYQKHAWPWPANWISHNTSDVNKPAAAEFRRYLDSEITDQKSGWQDEIQGLRIKLRETGVLKASSTRTPLEISSGAVAQIDDAILGDTSSIQTHE
ncbi:hypothetical protein [Halorubrum sp. DM2]|uniref:hypothetical protein n=1 Tax=Halorubrum sp. DM2 TaxID=2527867 RepID=UPI0024B64A84|nr:hypothetical protein [Halorubrum sp. DM2]